MRKIKLTCKLKSYKILGRTVRIFAKTIFVIKFLKDSHQTNGTTFPFFRQVIVITDVFCQHVVIQPFMICRSCTQNAMVYKS